MADPELQKRNPGLGTALVKAFQESQGDDPRVQRYLALAIGRLAPPPRGATDALLSALPSADAETRIAVVWALGATGDPAAVPALQKLYGSDDAGVRKVVVFALGVLPGETQRDTLRTALNDPAADVQWNAAVALAEDGMTDGVPVLRRMLDRAYVEKAVTRTATRDGNADPVGDVMISGVRAASRLKAGELHEPVVALSRGDDSLKVRQAALEALRDWPHS
jgi:HEAT repeat protein